METENFPAWLKAQKGVPRDVKKWMAESYAAIKEARDTGRMTAPGFEVAVELLQLIAESYINGTQDALLKDLTSLTITAGVQSHGFDGIAADRRKKPKE